MALDSYLKTIRKYVPMTKEEEKDFFKKAKGGDRRAYEKIIESNLRFVVSVAKKYQNQGLELEDLIAERNVGLIKAYEKFDFTKNFKFITYAVWWIRQAIIMAIHENSKLIRLPNNKINSITKANKLMDRVEQEIEQHSTYEAFAEYLDNPELTDDLKYHYKMLNLNNSYSDSEKELGEIIADPNSNIDIMIELVQDELEDILTEFTPRERDIIYMYFGIDLIRAYSLKEIGIDMGLTRERIRQIKEKVLEKLREKHRADRLRDYIK